MTIKNAVYYAAMLLQLDDTLTALENGELDEEALRLLRCGNLVVSEIASEYYPLKDKIKLSVDERGEITFDSFPVRPIEIFSAKDRNGISTPFTALADLIVLPSKGEYEFTYSYEPPLLQLEDDLPFPTKITERIVAYGIACEYCLISSMTDEAVTWDKRYKDALREAVFPKTEKRVKRRGWR